MHQNLRILAGLLGPCLVAAAAEVAPEMIRVPAGIFTPPYTNMAPVKVSAFLLDVCPVTNRQYLEFIRANPRWARGSVPSLFADQGYLRHWRGPDTPGEAAPLDSPVTSVSWYAARAYAEWRGQRLPTLAEWERAAASLPADTARDTILAWYARPVQHPLPAVGTRPASGLGLKDLHGLIWEWVEDFDAVAPFTRAGSDEQTAAYFCGAGASGTVDPSDYATFLRYAFRGSLGPSHTVGSLGFRCAQSLPEASPPE